MVENMIRRRVPSGHRQRQERSWNNGWAANRYVEVSASHADCKTDHETNHEFHSSTPSLALVAVAAKPTLLGGPQAGYHVLPLEALPQAAEKLRR